jgi:hypothetical protein
MPFAKYRWFATASDLTPVVHPDPHATNGLAIRAYDAPRK